MALSHAVAAYGVGAGDSAGDDEGAGLLLCTAPVVVL
jgi:hypothetical protein